MQVVYTSIDRVRIARQFKTLAAAQRFAQKWVGAHPDLAGNRYAISDDGVGKITAEGVTLRALFPEPSDEDKPVEIVSSRTLAAYRAHRTMIAKQMRGASKSVRTDLAAKLAGYDRLLDAMKVAA